LHGPVQSRRSKLQLLPPHQRELQTEGKGLLISSLKKGTSAWPLYMKEATTARAAMDSTLTARPTGEAALEPDEAEAAEAEAAADADVSVAAALDSPDEAVDVAELDGTVTVSLELAVALPAVEPAVTVVVVEPVVALPEADGQRAGT
jgi:hypothetical protein